MMNENKAMWKYELPVNASIALEVPADFIPLTVQAQFNYGMLWGLCTPAAPVRLRIFHVVATGSAEVKPNWYYVGTFQLDGGNFVYHVFGEKDERQDKV